MPDPVSLVMMTVTLPGRVSLHAAARRLGVPVKQLDTAYGVVALDQDNALYAVRVRADAAAAAGKGSVSFADPKIRPLS